VSGSYLGSVSEAQCAVYWGAGSICRGGRRPGRVEHGIADRWVTADHLNRAAGMTTVYKEQYAVRTDAAMHGKDARSGRISGGRAREARPT
jgi:hypothetical protein